MIYSAKKDLQFHRIVRMFTVSNGWTLFFDGEKAVTNLNLQNVYKFKFVAFHISFLFKNLLIVFLGKI